MPTKIEWAEESLNIVTGCTKASEGCKNCYAEKMAKRLKAMGRPEYQLATDKNGWTGEIGFVEERLNTPKKWRKPRRVFLNSMSDTFHEKVGGADIWRMLNMIWSNPKHTFIVVTKRAELAKIAINHFCDTFRDSKPIPNLWLLVSVENQKAADERIPYLLQTNAVVRGLSMEPLLERIEISSDYLYPMQCVLHDGYDPFYKKIGSSWSCPSCGDGGNPKDGRLDWVIVGGESGSGARPMHRDCVREIRDICVQAGIPFFFKQWGAWAPCYEIADGWTCLSEVDGNDIKRRIPNSAQIIENEWDGSLMVRIGKKRAGRMLDNREWDEVPNVFGHLDELFDGKYNG